MKRKRYFRVVLLVGMVSLFIVGLMPSPAPAAAKEVIKLKIGSGHPLATDWIKFTSDFFCKELVKRVNERTKYKLELSEHWAGSVAKLGEELESAEIESSPGQPPDAGRQRRAGRAQRAFDLHPGFDLSPEIPHLELWEWPRPPEDNGLGIHLGLDFREGALAEELRRVKDLGLKWVLLVPGDELQM